VCVCVCVTICCVIITIVLWGIQIKYLSIFFFLWVVFVSVFYFVLCYSCLYDVPLLSLVSWLTSQHVNKRELLLLLLLLFIYLFSLALQFSAGYGLLVHDVSWSHTTTRHSR
jgi:hypothetical protein